VGTPASTYARTSGTNGRRSRKLPVIVQPIALGF
jgi:hypothetical protein